MAGPKRRKQRIEDLLLEVIAEVFRKVKDPGVPPDGVVSFLGIEVAKDLARASVRYSYLGDEEKAEDLQAALERSKGFFRYEINRVVRLRKIPELHFQRDRSLETGSEILALLNNISEEGESRADETDTESEDS